MDIVEEALENIKVLSEIVSDIIRDGERVQTGLAITERILQGYCPKTVTIGKIPEEMQVKMQTFCGKTFDHEGECVADEKREHIFVTPIEVEEDKETGRTRRMKEFMGDK